MSSIDSETETRPHTPPPPGKRGAVGDTLTHQQHTRFIRAFENAIEAMCTYPRTRDACNRIIARCLRNDDPYAIAVILIGTMQELENGR